MGRKPDLPCDIEQVVDLLDPRYRHTTTLSMSILRRSKSSYECEDTGQRVSV